MFRAKRFYRPMNTEVCTPRVRQIIGIVLAVVAVGFSVLLFGKLYESVAGPPCPYAWHGGSPSQSHVGSCWCGNDNYCMCTPSLAIDAIIEHHQHGTDNEISILLVYRRDPPKDLYAIPGGFVDVGETVESAVIREVKEETNLTVSYLEQFRMYSDPKRDKRRHTVSMVFRTIVDSVKELHTGDDAKQVQWINAKDVLTLKLAFDHKIILEDYLKKFHPKLLEKARETRSV